MSLQNNFSSVCGTIRKKKKYIRARGCNAPEPIVVVVVAAALILLPLRATDAGDG